MDAPTGIRLSTRTWRTLLFALAYPVWIYACLSVIMNSQWAKYSAVGMAFLLGMAAVGCAVAWLVVRPTRIRWFTWPWWGFALLATCWVVRAWLLTGTVAWPEVLAGLLFNLVVVGVQEEFIYRGCVEEGFAAFGPLASAIVAGLFFGATHAPLAMIQGADPVMAVVNWLGGGVVYHLAMRWLREKGGLAVPVLVHGFLDFLNG